MLTEVMCDFGQIEEGSGHSPDSSLGPAPAAHVATHGWADMGAQIADVLGATVSNHLAITYSTTAATTRSPLSSGGKRGSPCRQGR